MKVVIAELERGDIVILPGMSHKEADAFQAFAEEDLQRLGVLVFAPGGADLEDVLILRAARDSSDIDVTTAAGDPGLLTVRNPRPGDDDALARP